jgi:hypothetical protein
MAEPLPPGIALDAFRRELLLTREDLWVDYVGVGGLSDIDGLTNYLGGRGTLSRLDHNTIAQALNDRFIDLGRNYPVPYLD